jgi:delta 1-pyrroline-5-carboxylate dehydrogenase
VAEGVIDMIQGAMQELRVGDPRDFATDVGPLIDADAHTHISRLVKRIQQKEDLTQVNQAQAAIKNIFFPQLIEVSDVAQVGEEIFGPVLQVLRWGPSCVGLETPHALVAAINRLGAAPSRVGSAGSAGYGLTLGLHTRIDTRALAWAQAAHVGNVYVNRNMIGAVVGLQPFGGDGLSGTGPKAGGPHYLYRFCTEQTVTINTTAAGGNVALMA